MKIKVLGDGSFGSFLQKELPNFGFELDDMADSVIFAIPISAYAMNAGKYITRHIINVCSVQGPSTDTILRYTNRVTSIHPLFGARTPIEKRNTIWTHNCEDLEGYDFIARWTEFSRIVNSSFIITPESHDKMMAKTHMAAVLAAKQMKHFVDDAKDIPDEYLPNSFRLLKQFVQTLEDMPQGTIESIMANPYA